MPQNNRGLPRSYTHCYLIIFFAFNLAWHGPNLVSKADNLMMTLKTILSFTEVSEYSSGESWVLDRLGEVVQDRKTS